MVFGFEGKNVGLPPRSNLMTNKEQTDKKVCQGCPDRFDDCVTRVRCQKEKEEIFKKIEGISVIGDASSYRYIPFDKYEAIKKEVLTDIDK